MAKKKSHGRSQSREPGLITAVQKQPTTSMWLMVGGALVGLFVASAVPAVRRVFGMSGLGSATRFRCPKTGNMITKDDCRGCEDQGHCPLYLKKMQG